MDVLIYDLKFYNEKEKWSVVLIVVFGLLYFFIIIMFYNFGKILKI